MRSSALIAAAVAGSAHAVTTELHTTVLTIGYTNSVGSAITAVTTYIYEYSNPQTSLLTQTNSEGIITGLPDGTSLATSQPAVETSQPAVATIPAGLPIGTTVITLPAASGTGATSFTVVVGSSTTSVVGEAATAVAPTGTATGTGSDSTATGSAAESPSGTSGSNSDSSSTASGTSASSTGDGKSAASGLAPVSLGLLSLGALFAALL